jgi:uncharacterized protein YbaP (TraB family)
VGLWKAAVAAACAASIMAAPAVAQAPVVDEEIIVTGRQPGPKMWLVADEDSEVWLLGVVNFLPKQVEWDTSRVEAVLDRADLLLTPVEARVGLFSTLDILFTDRELFQLPKKTGLRDVLAPDLYARFSAARASLGEKSDAHEKLKPLFAGEALFAKAVDRAGLDHGREPIKLVTGLAKRRKVKIAPVRRYDGKPVIETLEQMSAAAHAACLATRLSMIESGMPALREYIDAWAVGNVDALRTRPLPPEARSCQDEIIDSTDFGKAIQTELPAAFRQAVADGLAEPGARLILLDIRNALDEKGVIADLREHGYEVSGP